MSSDPRSRSSRHLAAQQRGFLIGLGLAYLAFVIYGSLVPLKYQALPWDEAVARFHAIPFLQLGIGSRADWMANLLLFIPLAFLWNGGLVLGRPALLGGLVSLLALVAATGLSLGLEFTQLWFPQRTVSQNDIAAETLGALFGIAAWWGFGPRLMAWHVAWKREREPAGLAERAAWLYFAVVVGYSVLPLDLTISMVELYHKWHEGKVHLLPFAGLPGDPAHALFEIVTDALLWAPLAWLWRARPGRDFARVWRMAFLAAASVELLQLFVYSRVSDVTDLFTGALGAGLGAWLGERQFGKTTVPARSQPAAAWTRLLPALAWLPVLLLVFWYPFDFRTDGDFVRERMSFLERVPFETYYYGTEFRAITEVFHKTLFFAPLGVLLARWVAGLSWRWRGYAAGGSIVAIIAVSLAVELGQVLLPGKFADTTDWLLESLGGLLGYLGYRMAQRTTAQARQRSRASRPDSVEAPTPGPEAVERPPRIRHERARSLPATKMPAFWRELAVGVGLLAALAGGAALLPGMPYNVRELFGQNGLPLSAFLLALFWFWFAGVPALLGMGLDHVRRLTPYYPLAALLHALISSLLLLVAAPIESIDDVAGSPILGMPWEFEHIGRLTALFLVPSILFSAGAWLARATTQPGRPGGLPVLVGSALLWLALAHWVVVEQASTDNLIELMAGGGGILASLALSACLLLLAVCSSLLGMLSGRSAVLPLAGLIFLAVPAGYGLLALGLESDLEKYGQHFSALQFLLSQDRTHLASGMELVLRFSLGYIVIMAVLAFAQRPFIKLALAQGGIRPGRP